ncbi:hypothetical protein MKY04_12600 [Lysinibacillus telephonicus]|uniref:hypothetical protein n=1 Tax=Lysinibacillus telephonicus TaxID=1714840 RepID=UPI0031FD0E4D
MAVEKIKEKAKATTEQVTKVIESVASLKFTKQQLLKSKKYVDRRDVLNALLKDHVTYTHKEVEKLLNEFYKGGKK